MAWATAQDVLDLTGATVDTAGLAQAQGVIELFAGVTEDNTELSDKALRALRLAVVYQAAWMSAQVDVTARMEVARLEQDGTVLWFDGQADSQVLAPLARRALARLPWASRGSIRLTVDCTPAYASMEAYEAAWLQDGVPGAWRPL